MTDDPPHWFGEPTDEETPPVDPPSVSTDWFSDIESDTLPTRSTATQATEAPETARQEAENETDAGTGAETEAAADGTTEPTATDAAGEEPTTASAGPEPTAAGEDTTTATTGTAGTTEMDGNRETTAERMAAEDSDDDSGGFVAWLKSLFGLS